MTVRFPNLQVEFGYLPKSFWIFGYEISMYGILLALGLILGVLVIVLEAKRKNQSQNMYLGAAILSLILGTVGARLWYALFHFGAYAASPEELLRLHGGGFSFFGALLGGSLALAIVAKIRKFSFGEMADTVSIGLVTGQIITAWGCFFSREAFGEYTNALFAMELPVSAVHASDVTALMRENLIDVGGTAFVRVHPLFLYESAWCLLLLLVLLARKRKKRFSGEVFMRYLAGYGFGRFFLSWLRTDELRIPGTGIAVSQIICAAMFFVFGIMVLVKRSMAKKRADVRKRRREKVYEEEEKLEAELARQDAEQEKKQEAQVEFAKEGANTEPGKIWEKVEPEEEPAPAEDMQAQNETAPAEDPQASEEAEQPGAEPEGPESEPEAEPEAGSVDRPVSEDE